jgi:hypothetical protein
MKYYLLPAAVTRLQVGLGLTEALTTRLIRLDKSTNHVVKRTCI